MLFNFLNKKIIFSFLLLNLFLSGNLAFANPEGGNVIDGSASIINTTSTRTDINQHSDKVIIDWNSFNVKSNEKVNFNQPSSSSVALNRINDVNPSNIAGSINANGKIFLINPNGILFTSTSKIDVNSLFATTSNISNENFKNGKYIFDGQAKDASFINNQGVITSSAGGYVVLAAPNVINSGSIISNGVAGIYSGNKFVLDYSDNVKVNISSNNPSIDSEDPLVLNSGLIQGQKVYLAAGTENLLIKNAVNTTGIIKASGAKMENGEIVLGEVNIDGQSGKVTIDGTVESDNKIAVNSGDLSIIGELKANDISILADYVYYDGTSDVSGLNGGSFSLDSNNLDLFGKIYAKGTQGAGGNVNINVTEKIMSTGGGIIDVSGYTSGGIIKQSASGLFSSGSYLANGTNGSGGTIKIGGSAALLSATFEAKGKTGGGIINIGGDWQGGANLSDDQEKLKQADSAFISSGTNIDASVTGLTGNGGEAVVWSTGDTEFYGNINVSQGSVSGNGGKVEVSGDELTMTEGSIITGKGGSILLDPHNLVISNDSPQAVEAVKLALNYFEKSGTSFKLQDDDSFGTYIALNGTGNIMAVGANGDDTSGYENGALYIFSLNTSDLTQAPYFRYKMVSPVTNTTSYRYGQSIAFNSSGNILAVGAHCDDTGGTDRGAVYLYSFNTTTFIPTYKYKLTSGTVFTSAGYALVNSDFFGISLALNGAGDIMAVGAHGDDNGGSAAGAAYLFTLNTSDLTQAPVLKTKILNGTQGILLEAGDSFGRGISINNTGDILAVGASADDTNGTDRGAVYLFKLNTSTLVPTQVYTVASGISGVTFANTDNFGLSVSLNGAGNIMAVGVPLQDTGETSGNRGSVRIFTINTDDITQVTHKYKLAHGSGTLALSSADNFGQSVALNDTGDILAVGAHLDDNGGPTRGAAHLFNLNISDLTQTPTYRYKLASIVSSLELADLDAFGYSIALNGSGNLLAVGTTEDDIGGTNRGAVYLFSLDTSDLTKDPTFRHKIGSGNPYMTILSNDQFGSAVALNDSGSVLVVGARMNDTGGSTDRGAVFLFSINTSDLTQAPEYKYTVGYTTVTGLSVSANDYFGSSVALNAAGDIMAVGAPYNDTGSVDAGAVFLFTLNPADLSQSPVWKYKLAHGLGVTLVITDEFGTSVALNGAGDILAVGANEDNNNSNQFGEVYLFTLNTSNLTATPVFKNKIATSLGVSFTPSNFGESIALNDTGNILAVGDSFTVTNGMYRGGVYLFNLNTADLTQSPVLRYKLEDGKAGLSLGKADYFGSSVALNSSGDIFAVGAMLDDTGGNDRGSAYLFSLNTTDLTQDPIKKYKIAEGTKGLSLYNGDYFGISSAFNNAGDILAVGAYGDNTGGGDRGAVYLFNLDTSDLTKAPILKFKLCSGHGVTLANSDYFGYSVALNGTGDILAVGAIYDDTAGGNAGAVYLFELDPDNLTYPYPNQRKKFSNLTGYTLVAGDQFGVSVALNDTGNILAVGANNDDTGFSNGGAVYLFTLDPSALYNDPVYKYKITNATAGITTSTNEYFGRSVALNGVGDILAVGAPNNDTDGTDKGVVYLFNLDTLDLTQTPQKKYKISGSLITSIGPNIDNSDYIGSSVALNQTGNILAVGMTGWDWGLDTSAGYGFSLNLNPVDLSQTPTFRRYIEFEYYSNANMYFGSSIALDATGNIIAVGAYGSNIGGYQRGAVYIKNDIDNFSYDKRYTLKSGSIGDDLCSQSYFGRDIALNGAGNILAVGSPNDNRGFEHAGAVYLFSINSDDITQAPVLGYKLAHGTAGLNLADGDWFGESVALNSAGDILAVGADWDLNNGNNNGEIYLFNLNPFDLTQTPVLKNKLADSFRSYFIDDTSCLDFAWTIALNGAGDILATTSYRNHNYYVDIISLNASDLTQDPVLECEFLATPTSLALNNEGNILAIGNISDDTGGMYAGAVSIYSLNPANLTHDPVFKLKLTDGVAGLDLNAFDTFGESISLNGIGDKLAVLTDYDIYTAEVILFSLNIEDLTQEPVTMTRLFRPNMMSGIRHFNSSSIALNDSGNLLAVGDYGDWTLGNMTGAVLLYNLNQSFTDSPSVDRHISANLVSSFLSSGSNVTLQANNDIFLNSAITANNASGDGGTLTLQAGRSIILANNITSDNGNINIIANETLANGVVNANRDSGNAVITMFDNVSIDAGTGSIFFDLKEGSDKTYFDSGSITLNNITANDITILNEGLTANSNLVINNNAVLTATGTGNSIVLSSANGNFINNYNSSALNTAGRWLIYSLDNINIVKGGLTGTPMYPGTYLLNSPETIPGSDNRFIYADGNFHIVTADNLNKIYGSANPTLTYNMSSTDALDTVTGIPVLSVSTDENSNTGSYTISTSMGTLASSLGYDIVLVDGTLAITPKSLTVTADDKTKIYGSANPSFSENYSGFVLGQDNSVLSGMLAFSTTANETSNVGNYAITPSGLTSNNYSISFVDGTLSITPKSLTVTANDSTKVYGSSNPAFTVNYAGLITGDDASDFGGTLSFSTLADNYSDVGNYSVTPSGLTSGNYSITYADGNLSITPKTLTIKADDKTKIYQADNPALTASYSGFAAGDDTSDLVGTLSLFTTVDKNTKVGNYAITPSGLSSGNYSITFENGVFSIIYDVNKVDGEFSSTLSNSLSSTVNPGISLIPLNNVRVVDRDNILKTDNIQQINNSVNYYYDPTYLLFAPNKDKLKSYLF